MHTHLATQNNYGKLDQVLYGQLARLSFRAARVWFRDYGLRATPGRPRVGATVNVTMNAATIEGCPPSLSVVQLSTVATSLFPLARIDVTSVKDLVSYYDKNYYFRGTLEPETASHSQEEGEFVLKITNIAYSPDLVRGLTSLMTFLSSRGFRVPRPLASRDGLQVKVCSAGELLGDSTCHSGCHEAGNVPESSFSPPLEYCVRLLPYIPDEVMDLIDIKYLTPKLAYSMGNLLGRLDVALKVRMLRSIVNDIMLGMNWLGIMYAG